jgi:exodeoxyribonuclease VII large subunit
VISAVGHEIDNALSDLAADLRAPTPSAAAELVSANRSEARLRIGGLKEELIAAVKARIDRARLLAKPFNVEDLEQRFRAILQPALVRFDDAKEAILKSLTERIAGYRRRVELAAARLEAGSPLAALERGFSVVTNERTGLVLRRPEEALPGDGLSIRLLAGLVKARTEKTEDSTT